MSELFAREATLALLHEHVQDQALRRHSYAVEAAMRAAAERTGQDPEMWGAVGLLHDLDYERFPQLPDHPLRAGEILRERGYPESFVRTILSHADHTGVPRETECARYLYALDELCGFCMACALVQPDRRIASVKVSSVKKKLKRKEFAARVDRRQIQQGAEELGLEPDELVALALSALGSVADRLGL